MLWVDGLRLGSRTRFALDQSTNSALSRASQNLRSCASDLNRESLVFAVMSLPFLSRVSRVTTVSGSVVPAIMDRLYFPRPRARRPNRAVSQKVEYHDLVNLAACLTLISGLGCFAWSTVALGAETPAPQPDSLVGVWGSENVFGPFVRGELFIAT